MCVSLRGGGQEKERDICEAPLRERDVPFGALSGSLGFDSPPAVSSYTYC